MIKLNNNEISFALITLAYWFFMLTDGALRMLVLLHFHVLGYTPLQLAYLFLLYEFLGMITNLGAEPKLFFTKRKVIITYIRRNYCHNERLIAIDLSRKIFYN